MPISKRSLPVACTLEDAFEYVADWTNLKNFLPMFVDIKPVSLVHYGPGTSLETTVMLGKLEMATTLDLVEFKKNQRILFKASRGLKSKASWDFAPLGNKTLVTFTFEYEIPPGIVTRDYDKEAIEKSLQEQATNSMDLLKWVLEIQSGKS
jgi:ribosome-associated toxin RatA of RatAB toxin-antitoxin module